MEHGLKRREHLTAHWCCIATSAFVWQNQDRRRRNKAKALLIKFFLFFLFVLFGLTCRWRTGCTLAPQLRWAPGPPGSVSGPKTAGGSWMLWRTHGSPPGWPRPPHWGQSAGLQHKHTRPILLALCSSVAYLIFQSEWGECAVVCDLDGL